MSNDVKQLSPTIPVITPLGPAEIWFTWTTDVDVIWGCFQDKTGEFWWWENQYIRINKSITDGRYKTSPINIPADMAEALEPHKKRYG